MFEKKQAEKFIIENPDIQDLTVGFVNLIAEGKNDIENI